MFYLATNFSVVWCTAGEVDPRSRAYCWPCSSEMGPLVRSDGPQDPMAMTLRAVDSTADRDAAAICHTAVLVRRTAVFHVEVAPWRTLGAAWGGRLSWVILPIRAQLHLGVWQEHMQQRPLWGGSRCCGCTHRLFPATVATLFTLSVQARGHLRRETGRVIPNSWLLVPPTGWILSGGHDVGQRGSTFCPHTISMSVILELLWLSWIPWFWCLQFINWG